MAQTLTNAERQTLRERVEALGIPAVCETSRLSRQALEHLLAGLDSRNGTLMLARAYINALPGAPATRRGDVTPNIRRGEK
jgi:hypothetical protein